jgi:hypothetical protein
VLKKLSGWIIRCWNSQRFPRRQSIEESFEQINLFGVDENGLCVAEISSGFLFSLELGGRSAMDGCQRILVFSRSFFLDQEGKIGPIACLGTLLDVWFWISFDVFSLSSLLLMLLWR